MKSLSVLVLSLLLSSLTLATTLLVPSQYPTIQAGINAAVNGDTVSVADGIYTGTGNKNIDFTGKAIVVKSENGPDNCAIDCQNSGRGFYFHTNEDSNSVITGFKIINGNTVYGGGIYCSYSSPRIVDCQISGNKVSNYGGGIYGNFSHSIVEYCFISNDSANWDGGAIFLYASPMIIRYCEISENRAWFAGGIWCEESDPIIEHCIFTQNVATWDGGGILVGFYSNVIITDCIFEKNTGWRGGGIWCHKSDMLLENCTVSQNSADCGGGIISYWQADAIIQNCTICDNSVESDGGGIHCSYSNTEIINTIVAGSQGNGGIYFGTFAVADIRYGDFHNNENDNFTGAPPAGLGIITGININGDSCDVFHNIFQDPLFIDPINGNYQLTWANFPIIDSTQSPCIDAGDPEASLDPDSTLADIGALFFDQGDFIVTLSSANLPLVIPANGGSFNYTIEANNLSLLPVDMEVWCDITMPNGQLYGPVMGPFPITLLANASLSRLRTQSVPARAPAGSYYLNGYIGDYPDSLWHQDRLPFTKLALEESGLGVENWSNSGDIFAKVEVLQTVLTLETFRVSIHPNPFNSTTVIRYELPTDNWVKLEVFDITGKLLHSVGSKEAVFQGAGVHEVVLDGSKWATGVYIYRIQAGQWRKSGKIVLVK
jgi:hypothetical protein